jgi:hypothetical protein
LIGITLSTMSSAFDLLYKLPRDPARERRLTDAVSGHGGRLDHVDETAINVSTTVCLTYEFDDLPAAERCAVALRGQGEHVEGPYEYGG